MSEHSTGGSTGQLVDRGRSGRKPARAALLGLVVVSTQAVPTAAQVTDDIEELIEQHLEDTLWRERAIRACRDAGDFIGFIQCFGAYLASVPKLPDFEWNPGPMPLIFREDGTTPEPGPDPYIVTAVNSLGVRYSVPFGSYDGRGIVLVSENTQEPDPDIFPNRMAPAEVSVETFGSGWSFEPQGFLFKSVELLRSDRRPAADIQERWECQAVVRYYYLDASGETAFDPRGPDPRCTYIREGGVVPRCMEPADFGTLCPGPTEYWSRVGQIALDVSDPSAPVLRHPDGRKEVLRPGAVGALEHHQSFFNGNLPLGRKLDRAWQTDRVIDRNGNVTRFEYDAQSRLQAVVDPLGRTTTYERDAAGRVTRIRKPGFGGAPLTWSLTWESFAWDPAVTFNPSEDFACRVEWQDAPCPPQTVTTLTRLELPDGRAYRFTYEPWGGLKTVDEPGGARLTHSYGGPELPAGPPGECQVPEDSISNGVIPKVCPDARGALHKLSPSASTTLPGAGAPALAVRSRSSGQQLGAHTASTCGAIVWSEEVRADGSVRRIGYCHEKKTVGSALNGRIIASELRDASGALVEGTYFGNPGTIGDGETPVGGFYAQWSRDPNYSTGEPGPVLDFRQVKIVHVRDGLTWSEHLTYDESDLPERGNGAPAGPIRTLGNLVSKSIRAGATSTAAELQSTNAAFLADDAYLARNLIRLPTRTVLRGPEGRLSRTDLAYDETALLPSAAPNREDPGSARGNLTSSTSYRDAQAGAGGVTSRTAYFDTGDLRSTTDPNGHTTTVDRTFGLCSSRPVMRTTTHGALPAHVATADADCFTGAVLESTDPNGATTTHAYDVLGRRTSTRVPGDTSDSETVEYCLLESTVNSSSCGTVSSLDSQRTVVRAKDGSSAGQYVKTFTDGLGRTVQTRAKAADPDEPTRTKELVATTEYDNMGRVAAAHVPCFQDPGDSRDDCASAPRTTTTYDALGRVLTVVAPGGIATRTEYGSEGGQWVATTTNPNGNRSRSFADLLGRVVKVSREWPGCAGGWCDTTMTYDTAGRLLSTSDPAGNTMTMAYDDLGRKTAMHDPDMGQWSYEYDDSGNLVSQTDAKGQTVRMRYDALNRLTHTDLPPEGPSDDDRFYTYDGAAAPDCSFDIAPTSATLGSGGGTGTIQVGAGSGCAWSVEGAPAWATVSPTQGSGSGTVTYSVPAHTGASARSETFTIAGRAFTLTQSAPACGFELSATSASFGGGGGAGSVAVTTAPGCTWRITNVPQWVTIAGGTGDRQGSGAVSYTVQVNTLTTSRSQTLTIAGVGFTVSQAAPSCAYRLSPTAQAFGAAGGTGGFSVSADPGCAWEVANVPSWITNLFPSGGIGDGSVSFTVQPASNGTDRSQDLMVRGQLFRVSQQACAYEVSPTAVDFGNQGGASAEIDVVTGSGCTWSAVSDQPWLRVVDGAGLRAGSGVFEIAPDPNTSEAPREASVAVGGRTVLVTQIARGASLSLAADEVDRPVTVPPSASLGVAGSFTVEAWVKPGAAASGAVVTTAGVGLELVSGRPRLRVTGAGGQTAEAEASSALAAASWHHVAGVWDQATSELRLYVNGTQRAAVGSGLAPAGGVTGLTIGPTTPDFTFGAIDEVRLSSAALYSANFAPEYRPRVTSTTRGLWSFDDQTARDASPHRNDGSRAFGSYLADFPRQRSLSLPASGQGRVLVPHSPSVDIGGNITVEAWVNTSLVSANQRIVSRVGVDGSGYVLKLIAKPDESGAPTHKLKFTVSDGATQTGVTSTGTVPANGWHHVAGVHENGSLRVYVDGQRTDDSSQGAVLGNTVATLVIGAAEDGDEPFVGLIDVVAVAGRPFYGAPFVPETRLPAIPGTKGLWRFDGAFPDASAFANDGSPVGPTGFSESAPDACDAFAASPKRIKFGRRGGGGKVRVSPPPGCDAATQTLALQSSAGGGWQAVPAEWLHLSLLQSELDGSYTIDPNDASAPRRTAVSLQGQPQTVDQDGLVCQYALTPGSLAFTSSGGTGKLVVSAPEGCAWSLTGAPQWITITGGASGNGNGQATFTVAANPGTSPRVPAVLSVSNATPPAALTVTQQGIACQFAISPTSVSFTSAGGTGSVGITGPAACNWSVTGSLPSWFRFTAPTSGSGSGALGFTVDSNSGAAARPPLALTIAGRTFTVTQSGSPCTATLTPTGASFSGDGGSGTVDVAPGPTCGTWSATNLPGWITIPNATNRTGAATLTYSVDPNTTGTARSQTLQIAGRPFTVTQEVACRPSLSAPGAGFSGSGGTRTGSVGVTVAAGCPWAVTAVPEWVTITSISQATGSGTVTYAVADNPLPTRRAANLLVAGQTYTVTEEGLAPAIAELSPGGVPLGSGETTLTVDGANFMAAAVVHVGGSARATRFVSPTRLLATLTAQDAATAAALLVTAVNPDPGAGASAPTTFTVNNPAPVATQLSPSTVTAGSGTLTLTVDGTGFVSTSVVRVGGADRATTFVSATRLTTALAASELASGRQLPVSVVNAGPGGGTSVALTLTVENPQPVLTALVPATATVGTAGTLTLDGSGFVPTSVVRVGGADRATDFVSSTRLTAALLPADVAATGVLAVHVFNPAPAGGATAELPLSVENPAPSIARLTPAQAVVGNPLTVTVDGAGFVGASVAEVDGVPRPTTVASATRLTVSVPAEDVAVETTRTVTVVNPAPGGGESAGASLPVVRLNPPPSIGSISPTTAVVGSGGLTLTVTGSGFVGASKVRVGGAERATTVLSSTQLQATILAADLAAVGPRAITVFNPTPGGGESSAVNLDVIHPTPVLGSLTPATVTALGGAFTLTVDGSGFVSGSVVRVGGADRATTFVSATRVTASIPSSDVATAGTRTITVFTPAPGGGQSGAATLTVMNPLPAVSSITPASVVAGNAGFSLTVNGTGFVSGGVVRLAGVDLATTFLSATQVTASVPASAVATGGSLSVTVVNPAPGGGQSSSLTLSVTNPVPSLTSIATSPTPARVTGPFTLTVNGKQFVTGSVVRVAGANQPTTFVSSGQLTVSVPAGRFAAGTYAVTVFNPTPGGGQSGALSLVVSK
jgi:YD repeat-containing protein